MAFVARLLPCLVTLQLRLADSTGCSVCCSPGGSCESAFHGRPGVCCGLLQCCPVGSYCVRCGSGFRCAGSPYARCNNGNGESVLASQSALVILAVALVLSFCLLRSLCERSPTTRPIVGQPIVATAGGGQVVASPLYQTPYPPHNDGMVSGMVGGMVSGLVVGTILSDLDEPPTYAEVTDAGYQPDAA